MKVEESNHGSRKTVTDLLLLVASAVFSPPPATPVPEPIRRPWTERVAAYSAAATSFLTVGIIVLGVSQCAVNQGQLAVMQRQLNDSEIKDSAALDIRNFSIGGFPDHTIAGFDISNGGPTRADMVVIVPTFIWAPGKDLYGIVARNANNLVFCGPPNEFGITLAPGEVRHLDMPISTVGSSEEMSARMPTCDQLISGEYTSLISVTAVYKTVFGKVERVNDCAIYQPPQQFHHCWGDRKQIVDPMEK
jgi:hypothetical protein